MPHFHWLEMSPIGNHLWGTERLDLTLFLWYPGNSYRGQGRKGG